MSEIRTLKNHGEDLNKILIKSEQAIRIRENIIKRITSACEKLTKNIRDVNARRSLTINLEREKNFLDIVINGSRYVEGILYITGRELEHSKEISDDDKAALRFIMANLLDAMRFVRKKEKVLKKRIKKGEKLLKGGAILGVNFEDFKKTIEQEAQIDRELALRLAGKMGRINNPMIAMLKKYGLSTIVGGAYTAITLGNLINRDIDMFTIGSLIVLTVAMGFMFVVVTRAGHGIVADEENKEVDVLDNYLKSKTHF